VATSSRPREHASYQSEHVGGAIDGRAAVPRARLASLDGLRALSIGAVILGHLSGTPGFPAALAPWLLNRYWDVANLGVRVFFVISGFLITHLLLREEEARGAVSLRAFYARRIRRILPAYLTYVFVVAALAMWDVVSIPSGGLLAALTFTMNYTANGGVPLSHVWSLAVEEQFYLLWPPMLVLLGRRRAAWAALAVVLLAPVARVGEHMLDPTLHTRIAFETNADLLAIGCLLALWREPLSRTRWYGELALARWTAPVLLLLGTACNMPYHLGLGLGQTIVALAIALMIDRCIRRPNGLAGRVLNARPIVALGTISYSLYLWQQLFVVNHWGAAVVGRFPVNVGLALAVAWLSRRYVELPALRGGRWAWRRSGSRLAGVEG
jgi:peptidoglycan/LPS O-acetylase OafA/YrhL